MCLGSSFFVVFARMKLSESDVTETPFSEVTTDPGETDVEGDLEQT